MPLTHFLTDIIVAACDISSCSFLPARRHVGLCVWRKYSSGKQLSSSSHSSIGTRLRHRTWIWRYNPSSTPYKDSHIIQSTFTEGAPFTSIEELLLPQDCLMCLDHNPSMLFNQTSQICISLPLLVLLHSVRKVVVAQASVRRFLFNRQADLRHFFQKVYVSIFHIARHFCFNFP